jgi:hypothetical protein
MTAKERMCVALPMASMGAVLMADVVGLAVFLVSMSLCKGR